MFVLCRHLSTFTVNSEHVSTVGLNKLLLWELTLGRSTKKLASSPSPKILQRRKKQPYSCQAQGTLLICFRGFLLLLQVCCRHASEQPALQQDCGVVPGSEEVWSHWPGLSVVGVHGAVLFSLMEADGKWPWRQVPPRSPCLICGYHVQLESLQLHSFCQLERKAVK